jgi:hypothetical protein
VIRLPVLLVIVAFATLVEASAATESTIVPGVGIGKVKVGLTLAQVQKALGGKYEYVNERSRVAGRQYLEAGWDFGGWTIGFLRRGGTYRVAEVGHTLRGQRTAKRIGVGSSLQQVARTYPYAVCGYYALLIVSPNGVQTVFKLDRKHPHPTNKPAPLDVEYRVSEVVVRQPFRPQPEFAPRSRCRKNWLDENNPTPGPP